MESIVTNEDISKLQWEHGYIGRVVSYALLDMKIPKTYGRMLQFQSDIFSVNDVPFARLFREDKEVRHAVVLRSADPISNPGEKQGAALLCLKKLGVPVTDILLSPWLRYPFPQLGEHNLGGGNMYNSVFDPNKGYVDTIKNLYVLNLIQYLRMYAYNDWSRHKRHFWYRKYDWEDGEWRSQDDWATIAPKDILYTIAISNNHEKLLKTGIYCPYDIDPAKEEARKLQQGIYPPRKNRLATLLSHYREFLEDISYGVEAPPCSNDLVKALLNK